MCNTIFISPEGAQSEAALASKERWLYNSSSSKPNTEEDHLS